MSLLRKHIRTPLYDNAYSLIRRPGCRLDSRGIFWAVAARIYTTSQVGLGTGILSAALLLTSLASLGFDGWVNLLPCHASLSRKG